MIRIVRKSRLVMAAPAFLLAFSLCVMPACAGAADRGSVTEYEKSDGAISGFVIARSKIESALESYNNGSLEKSREDLNLAIEWLNRASEKSKTEKSIQESRILSDEIERLEKKLNQSTWENENSLLRFLHRTGAIIDREIDQLVHSYIELSTAEKTLKPLLDAKMHLTYAERDLLVYHDATESVDELDRVFEYLDDAEQEAIRSVQGKIGVLKNDIAFLKEQVERSREAWKSNDELILLHRAADSLGEAKTLAPPGIRARIESIESELDSLRKDIESASIKRSYDSAMIALKSIISEL